MAKRIPNAAAPLVDDRDSIETMFSRIDTLLAMVDRIVSDEADERAAEGKHEFSNVLAGAVMTLEEIRTRLTIIANELPRDVLFSRPAERPAA